MMDPDVEIMVTAACRPIPRGKVSVKLSSDYNRRIMAEEMEKEVDNIWDLRLVSNPKLWNGTKFRLSAALQIDDTIQLSLGITSYKDFIGTNWSPKAEQIKEMGKEKFGDRQAFMSDALGVGALVETKDNFLILIRRSKSCGEAVGLLDIPGGHPEPQELVGNIPAEQINIESMSEETVINEIFDSTLREIVDEVNIPIVSLTDPVFIGIARNTTSAGRPSSEYHVKCSMSKDEVLAEYRKGNHREADESTGISFIKMNDLPKIMSNIVWKELAPSAKGCLILYNLVYNK